MTIPKPIPERIPGIANCPLCGRPPQEISVSSTPLAKSLGAMTARCPKGHEWAVQADEQVQNLAEPEPDSITITQDNGDPLVLTCPHDASSQQVFDFTVVMTFALVLNIAQATGGGDDAAHTMRRAVRAYQDLWMDAPPAFLGKNPAGAP